MGRYEYRVTPLPSDIEERLIEEARERTITELEAQEQQEQARMKR